MFYLISKMSIQNHISNTANLRQKNKNPTTLSDKSSIFLKKIRWPLKKLSENYNIKHRKIVPKTSHDLFDGMKVKEKLLYLITKSEERNENNENLGYDSEVDSELSSSSIENTNISHKSKHKLEELISRYYLSSSENIPGKYESYVTNNIKLLSYFKSNSYFNLDIQAIKSKINEDLTDNLIKSSSNLLGSSLSESTKNSTPQKRLLILDLDETLIHSDLACKWSVHDYYIKLDDGSMIPLNERPFLYDFLDFCIEEYDLVLYTASCKEYADPIIDHIEKERKYFKLRLYREHCISYSNFYIKDLSIFNRPLKDVIIIDNNIFSFSHYLSNGILISSFYNDSNDLDLISLIEFFRCSIKNENDVRSIIEDTFGFEKILIDFKSKGKKVK